MAQWPAMQRLAIAIVVTFVAVHIYAKWPDRPEIGKPADAVVSSAHAFEAVDLDGKSFSFHTYSEARRLTVLVFVEAECVPCNELMPQLRALDDAFSRRGVGVVGVYRHSTRDAMRAMAKQYGVTFPMVQDTTGKIFSDYDVSKPPAVIVINGQMEVLRSTQGIDPGLLPFIDTKLNPEEEEKAL